MKNTVDRNYSVIVFDLGNVLIPFNYDLVIQRFNEVSQGLGDKFLKYYRDNYLIHRSFERGNLPEEEFIKIMLEVLENKIDKEKFCSDYSNVFTVNKDVADLLPILKKRFMLVLLSNTNSIHREYGWKDYIFLKYFDKLVLSYEVNAVKPEEKIYRAVESFTRKPSGEHIFIDDVAEYVQGAKNIGWDGVPFTGYDDLVKAFHERNIL